MVLLVAPSFRNPSLQKELVTRVQVLKERMSQKTKETWGRWMTEERMRKDKDLNLSNKSIQSIKSFCNKFPETHRRWGMNETSCYVFTYKCKCIYI